MVLAETTRLLFRELSPTDAPRLFQIYSDQEVMRFMGPPPASVEDERCGILRHAENYYLRFGYGLWAIIEQETGVLIGRAGLLQLELHGQSRVEVSYLLDRAYWGKGYATEAVSEIVRHAFDDLDLDSLCAVINPANLASTRVAERVGFRRQGIITYKQFGVVDLYECDNRRRGA